MVIQFLSVAAGGAVGACVRYALALLFPFVPGHWPIASFTANVLGCTIMGALFYLIQQAHLPLSVKPLLLAGFLGAMTTFSSFALEAWLLLQHNAHLLALAYLVVSVVACVCAIALGFAAAGTAMRLMG